MSRPASLRKTDMQQEKVIMQFLYDNMYSKLYPDCKLIDDTTLQMKGCDVALRYPNHLEYHDVKTQASKAYINNPTPTFAMELLFDLNGQELPGWFVKPNLYTTMYCFAWINDAKTNDAGYIDTPGNIHRVNTVLLEKALLKEYVNCFVSDEELIQKARLMRINEIKRETIDSGLTLVYSPQLNERPVNLVINRRILDQYAEDQYIVTPKGLTKV